MGMNFRKVNVFSTICCQCDACVTYIVCDDDMPAFSQVDESGDHRPYCNHCDFYSQQDLLVSFRLDAYDHTESKPGQPAQIKPL